MGKASEQALPAGFVVSDGHDAIGPDAVGPIASTSFPGARSDGYMSARPHTG